MQTDAAPTTPLSTAATLTFPDDPVAEYQIRRQGAAWSSVRRCALSDEVARVEDIFAAERARVDGINRRDGWIERDYEFGPSAVAVEIICWDHRACTSTVVARWRGGERRSLTEAEHGQALAKLAELVR